VGLALAVVAGARFGRPLPLTVGVGAAILALSLRRPVILIGAGLLLASGLSARAQAGLGPIRAAPAHGIVSLVADPTPTLGGERVLVRWHERRYELRSSGSADGAIAASLAGEQIRVEGRVRPVTPDDTWLKVHHVVGLMEATSAERTGSGSAPWRAANRVRRLLERGAVSLPGGTRSLFTGFVIGDDRDEPATVMDDFRASGLTHLLAVSGENVAFVLALLAPVMRRLRLGSRWALTVGAIGFFALITRGEPSVLRAAVMAVLAVSATTFGRQVSTIRLLALAVACLVLVDPFLVDSIGFRLSVGASLGIVLLAPAVRRSLPGPSPLAEALAVTLAAQAGVAPVMLASFGGLPVVAVPANLLAVPVAGLVMVWGLGAGLVAGVTGGGLAAALHLPTRVMIAWVSGVAERAAGLPLGMIGPGHAAVMIAGLAMVVFAVRSGRRRWIGPGHALVVLALLGPALAARWSKPPVRAEPTAGVVVWRAGGATVVEVSGRAPADRLLAALRQTRVRRIDLVIFPGGGATAAAQGAALRHRWPIGRVFQPQGGLVSGASVPSPGTALAIGGLTVTVVAVAPKLKVRVQASPSRSGASGLPVGSPSAPRARPPPPRRHVPSSGVRDLEPHPRLLL